ncbi:MULTISPECIES: hypothetical protein [unclassified Flavobacterium]|uniref:hypothetical protein n=1 Tax=unclassified Flavobacterium TaxID=196869 RepID=UPI003F8EACF1
MEQEIEKVLNFLNKYDYRFSRKNNSIFVNLELSQQIKIEFQEPNKIIITDKLIGWNFLTGMVQMSIKNALLYNFVGLILLGFICFYADNIEKGLNLIVLFLVFITWIILFSGFYLVKLEGFKNQLMNGTK